MGNVNELRWDNDWSSSSMKNLFKIILKDRNVALFRIIRGKLDIKAYLRKLEIVWQVFLKNVIDHFNIL